MPATAPSASPAASAATSRREMIARRQEKSPVWWIIHRLASLNFALILLATIAIACAAATFAESGFNSKIAHAYIYKNPLFLIWLGCLCINLFAVTLSRWPWQKKHIGFVVTHYGIITLLIGAMIGMHTGFEGNVTLRKGDPPVSRIVTSHSVIQLESPADTALYLMPFDAEATKPSTKRPRTFPVPQTTLKIVANDFNGNLQHKKKLVPSDSGESAPSVLMRFTGGMAGQTLELPFSLAGGQPAEEDFFGMARIAFHPTLPPVVPADEETQMAFAKYAPVVQSGTAASGLAVRLSEDGSKVTILSSDGTGATYLRKEIIGQPVTEGSATVTVENYWPDFAMENGKPVTKSQDAKNPAILVRILKTSAAPDNKPSLEMAPALDGTLVYQLRRSSQIAASGTAKAGDKFALGWADWQAEVLQVLPKAIVTSETQPGPPPENGVQGIPGFLAHLETAEGTRGPDQWIESGQLTTLSIVTNTADGGAGGPIDVRVGYGLESKPVPFTIRLTNFEIPRDEGTDTPADFRASIEFRDAKTGTTKTGLARMNHPASFPGTFLANLTGINYKFSQAEWNPRNLEETTLQVLYDPGWLLKWIGSLAIVIGIAIMFYWKPGGA